MVTTYQDIVLSPAPCQKLHHRDNCYCPVHSKGKDLRVSAWLPPSAPIPSLHQVGGPHRVCPRLPPSAPRARARAYAGRAVGFSRPERGRPLESPWTQKSWPLPPFPPSEAGPKASARFQLRWERGERLILDRAGGGLLGRRDGKRARTGEARPPLGPSDFIRLMLPRLLRTPRARHRTQPRRTRHRRRVAGRPARAVGGGPATTPPEPRAPPDRASRPPSPSP